MARGRIIATSLWRSETVRQLSVFERLLWVGLITTADDQGRCRANPALIRAAVFPMDDIGLDEVSAGLQRLAALGLVHLYRAHGLDLIQIVNWWSYQCLQWAMPSPFPAPEGWTDRIRCTVRRQYHVCNWNLPGGFAAPARAPAPGPMEPPAECPGGAPGWADKENEKKNENENDPLAPGGAEMPGRPQRPDAAPVVILPGDAAGANERPVVEPAPVPAGAAVSPEDGLFADVSVPPAPPRRTAAECRAATAASLARSFARQADPVAGTGAGDAAFARAWAELTADARLAEALGHFCSLFRRTPPNSARQRRVWAAGMARCAEEVGYDRLQPLMARLACLHAAGARGYDFAISDPHSIYKTLMRLRDEERAGPPGPPPPEPLPFDPMALRGSIFDHTITPGDRRALVERFDAEWEDVRARRAHRGPGRG